MSSLLTRSEEQSKPGSTGQAGAIGVSMTQPRGARRVMVVAAFLLIILALQRAEAQQPDVATRVAEYAKSKAAGNLYSPAMRAGVESVSWVRFVYGPAEYVLLGAPALALSLANGGPLGLGKKITFDLVREIIRESLDDPEQASRKMARSAYDLGLQAYRENYRLYGKVKKGEPLSMEEARAFLINRHLQDYMGAAKKLYNATTSYEGKDPLRQPDKALLQQLEATAVAQAREAFGGQAGVEVSVLLKATKLEFTVFESVVRASIGLGAYPPYQQFLRDTRTINEALAREIASLATVPSATRLPKVPADGTFDLCSGWDLRDGHESGFVRCQTTTLRSGAQALEVKRDNLTWKKLPRPLRGIVEFTAWALPARDRNTNFSIRIGRHDGQREAIIVGLNESNRWFHNAQGHQRFVARYSMDWTPLRLVIDTVRSRYSFWIDGQQVAGDVPVAADLSGGIDAIGVHSGRGAVGHSSYIEDMRFVMR